jgi:hypothetical protein
MSDRETVFWDYQDLLMFVAAFFPVMLGSGLLVGLLFRGFGLPGTGKAPQLLSAQFLAYALWFGFLYLILRMKYDCPFWKSLGWVRFRERFWQHVVSGVALALAVGMLGVLLRTPDLDTPMKHLLSDRLSVILIGVAAATVGPLCEELAFRGFVQPILVRSLGAAPGIVLTALPFALLHGPEYAWSWRHVLLIATAGCSFGWMRYRTGSTAAAAVVHAAYNSTFFAAMLISGKDFPAKW